MRNIFFDFDGTLINSQYRQYYLFKELCPEFDMNYDEYWAIKRKRINQTEFLKKYYNYDDDKILNFKKQWLTKIEEEERLNQDFLIDGILNILINLSKIHNLYIVTNRQSRQLAIKQIENLNITHFFKQIFITEQNKTKVELIKHIAAKGDFLISDTGEDINCAKQLGINSIAVSWGILDKDILKEYEPTKIIEKVTEIESCII